MRVRSRLRAALVAEHTVRGGVEGSRCFSTCARGSATFKKAVGLGIGRIGGYCVVQRGRMVTIYIVASLDLCTNKSMECYPERNKKRC